MSTEIDRNWRGIPLAFPRVVSQFEIVAMTKRATRRPPLAYVRPGSGQFVVQPSSVRRAAGRMYS